MNLRGYWQNIGELDGGGGDPIALPEQLYFRKSQYFYYTSTKPSDVTNIKNGKYLYYRINENEYKKIYSGGITYTTYKTFDYSTQSLNFYDQIILPNGTQKYTTTNDRQYQICLIKMMIYGTLMESDIILDLEQPNIIFSLPENKQLGDVEINSLQDITDMYCIEYENSYNYQKQPSTMIPYKFNGRYVALGSGGGYPSHVKGYANQSKFKELQNNQYGYKYPQLDLSFEVKPFYESGNVVSYSIFPLQQHYNSSEEWNITFFNPGYSLDYDINKPFIFGFTSEITIGDRPYNNDQYKIFSGEIPLILNYQNMVKSTAPVKIIDTLNGNVKYEVYSRIKLFSEVSI